MPVRRDPLEGRIIDEPTLPISKPAKPTKPTKPALDHDRRKVDAAKPAAAKPAAAKPAAKPVAAKLAAAKLAAAKPPPPVGGPSPSPGRRDAPAMPVQRAQDPPDPPDPQRTMFIRRGPASESGDAMDDPPVGWLVVVEGPGKGHVATLGTGINSVGRGRSERVSLDHGDNKISRKNHGVITYDPLGRKFYIQRGGGKSLTYVGDEPVLAPRELAPLSHVRMGDTVLRFVPLCGAGFSWEDEPRRG